MNGQAQRLMVLALLSLAGCSSDDQAQVALPTAPIARGAYAPLNVTDDCTDGGKLSFCTTEGLVSIDSIQVDDPSIASIVRMEELPEAQRAMSAQLVIEAKRAGTTRATIESTFVDGSKRTAQGDIVVQDIDLVRLYHVCSVEDPEDLLTIPVGRSEQMWSKLFHGETVLRGEYQETLFEGEGLVSMSGGLVSNGYVFTAAEAGSTELSSPVDPAFSRTLRAFTPDEATITAVEVAYPIEASYHDFVGFRVDLDVHGKRPCFYPALRVETLTPEVCDGAADATSWVEARPGYGITVRAVRSGTCKFTLAIDGNDADPPYTIETPLKVTGDPTL